MAAAVSASSTKNMPMAPGANSPQTAPLHATIVEESPSDMPPRLPPQVNRVLKSTPGSTPSGNRINRPTQSARGVREARRGVDSAMGRERPLSERGARGAPEDNFEQRALKRIFAKKTKLEARYKDLGVQAANPTLLPPCNAGSELAGDGTSNSIVDQFLHQLTETAPARLDMSGTASAEEVQQNTWPNCSPPVAAASEAADTWLCEAGTHMRTLVNGRGSDRLARELKELKAKVLRLERERNKLQAQFTEKEERVKQLEDDIKRVRQDPQMLHPAVQRLRKVGLNTPALADLNERWAGYVLGRTSMAMEVGSYAFRAVFATHAQNGVLTEDSFKSVIRQFEPTIKNDQLTRLWFFADSDGSGQLDLFEFMRMFGCNANGDMSDEYYEVVTMHMYRKFHSKGGIRRVYAAADRDQDQCLSPEEWEVFLYQVKLGLSRQDFNMTKQEMYQVFHRMNTSNTGLLSIVEFEAALEAAASKCYVSEKWVRDTFRSTAVAIQDEGINIRQLIPANNLNVKEFKDLMLKFTPRLRMSQLDRLWKFVLTQTALAEDGAPRAEGTSRVDTDAFLRVAFCPTLGASSGSHTVEENSDGSTVIPPGTGKEVLEQLAILLRKHTGDVPLELCFDSLDPFLTPDHFHKQLVTKFGLQYDTIKTKQMFSLIDMDRDGKITRYEFLSMFKKIFRSTDGSDPSAASENNNGAEPSAKMRESRLLNRVTIMESELKLHRRDPLGMGSGHQMYGEVISTVPEKQYRTLEIAHAKLNQMIQREREAFCAQGVPSQSPTVHSFSSNALRPALSKEDVSSPTKTGTVKSGGASEGDSAREQCDMDEEFREKKQLEEKIAQLSKLNQQLVKDFDVRVEALLIENEALRNRLDPARSPGGKSTDTLQLGMLGDDSSSVASPVARPSSPPSPPASREGTTPASSATRGQENDKKVEGEFDPELKRRSTLKKRVTLTIKEEDGQLPAPVRASLLRHPTQTMSSPRGMPQYSRSTSRSSMLAGGEATPDLVGPVRRALQQFLEHATWPLKERITSLNEKLIGAIVEDRFRIDQVVSVSQKTILTSCWDILLNRMVSLRLLYDTQMRHRRDFSYEVCVMSKLMSVPHIPSVYHFSGANSSLVFFAMELLQGETLAARFVNVQEDENAAISNLEAMEIADALLTGVDQCHQQDVVNLSIRPDTIWIAPPLSAARVRILSWENAVGIHDQPINIEFSVLAEEKRQEMASQPPKLVRGTDEADISTESQGSNGRYSVTAAKVYATKMDRTFPNMFVKNVGSLYYMPPEHLYSVIHLHETEASIRLNWEWAAEHVGPAAKVDAQVVHWFQRGNGLAMTSSPIGCVPLGRLFEVEVHKIMTMVRRGTSDLGFCIGLTTMAPSMMGLGFSADRDRSRVVREAFIAGGDGCFHIRGKRLIANAHHAMGEDFSTLVEGIADTEGRYMILSEGLRRGDRVGILAEWNGDLSVYVNGNHVGCCPKALRASEVFGQLYGLVDLYTREGADEHYVRAVSLHSENQQVLSAPNFGGERGTKKAQELRVIHELLHTSVETQLGVSCDVYACALVLLQCFRGGRAVPLPPALETLQCALNVWISEKCPKVETEFYLLASVLGLLTEREPSLAEIESPKLRHVLARALKKSRYSRFDNCWEFCSMLNQATGWQDMNSEFLTSHITSLEQARRRHAAEVHLTRSICQNAMASETKGKSKKKKFRSSDGDEDDEEPSSDGSGEEKGDNGSEEESEDEKLVTANQAAAEEGTLRHKLQKTETRAVVAVWDLQPFTLGHSHLTRAVQVVTEWDQRASIRVVAVRALAAHIPEPLQVSFVSCFNTDGPPHSGGCLGESMQTKKKKRGSLVASVRDSIQSRKQKFLAMRQDILWRALATDPEFTEEQTLPTLMLEDLPLPSTHLPKHRFPLELLLKRHLIWVVTHFVENLDLEPGPETTCDGSSAIGDSRSLVNELTTALARSRVLRHLNLRSSNLCEHAGRKIAAAVRVCPQLQWLDVSNNNLGPSASTELVLAADQGNNLTFLDLSRNKVGDVGVQSLSAPLTGCKTLRSLRLGVNGVGEEGSEALAESILTNTSLTSLNLCHNKITLASTLNLIRVTQATCTLKELDLEHNLPWPSFGGSEAVLQQLADCLGGRTPEGAAQSENYRVSCLTNLSLRHCNVRSECAAKIFEALARNPTLKKLNISWNGIRHLGTEELAKMLAEPRSQLCELDLRDNQVGTQDAIGHAFHQVFWRMSATDFNTINVRLRTLHLGNNELTANTVKLLVESLPAFVNLEELMLYHNPEIGLQGGQAIARLLSSGVAGMPKLRRLNVALCGLGDKGCTPLVRSMKNNERLTALDISGNHITDGMAHILAEALRSNRMLQNLSLGMSFLTSGGLRQMMDAISANDSSNIQEIDVSALAEPDYDSFAGIGEEVLSKFVGLSL